ncbi:dihydrodipicolinate synthase family protein [Paenibacillus sp. HB172176]|uniref:dihydrodipicolinate synthase family protein n=1 Tax=Paenibacillus sp. HB172176 TaxID=2493690 RepID=UPI00143C855D|nr:dihydrodipicolinate synthase family protein [Paenibacillus sp. HB172176]
MGVKELPNGVWPVMLTPFAQDGSVDYNALEQLIEWYIDNGVHGLFAMCRSSDMFQLTRDERIDVVRFVQEKTAGRVSVVASGHVSDSFEEQLKDIEAISEIGVDAVVLITNILAQAEDGEDVWKRNVETILERFPGTTFGLYECPSPFQRLLSPELIKWCGETGRFTFMKECSNNLGQILEKIKAVQGTPLKIYIANNPHLLEAMQAGGHGYSGMQATYQPDLYSWLTNHWNEDAEKAALVQSYLGATCAFEGRQYYIATRYYLQLEGIDITLKSRMNRAVGDFRPTNRREIEQFRAYNRYFKKTLFSQGG